MASGAGTLTRRLSCVGAIFVCSAVLTMGQIAGGLTETTNTRLGGNNFIVGTVYSPDGMPINTRMRIKLSSPTWGDILANTDDRGRFVFSGVGSGTYTITIDSEKEYEPVCSRLRSSGSAATAPETYTVMIRLRAIEDAKPKTGPGVISAANAGVPKPALDHYDKASKLAQAKDYDGAIKELKLAISEYPRFLSAHNQIGVLYLRLNDADHAEEAFKAALKINPEAYEPLLNRGISFFRLGKFKDAEANVSQNN